MMIVGSAVIRLSMIYCLHRWVYRNDWFEDMGTNSTGFLDFLVSFFTLPPIVQRERSTLLECSASGSDARLQVIMRLLGV